MEEDGGGHLAGERGPARNASAYCPHVSASPFSRVSPLSDLSAYPLLVTLTYLPTSSLPAPPSLPPPRPTSASAPLMENDSQSLNQTLSSSFARATQVDTKQRLQTRSINQS